MTKVLLALFAYACGILILIRHGVSEFWIWGFVIIIGLFMLLHLSWYIMTSNIVFNWRERLELNELRVAVEKDCEYKGFLSDLSTLWKQIYPMRPGVKRSELRQSLLTLIRLDLDHENYWQHPLCAPLHWYYAYDCCQQIDCGEITCPQCGKTVHFVQCTLMKMECVYAVNEEEKTVLTWNGVPPADLPPGYHTDECPYCNHGPLDFFAETAVNISLFRFLQDFTLILPDGKRVSLAETPPTDAGTEAKK